MNAVDLVTMTAAVVGAALSFVAVRQGRRAEQRSLERNDVTWDVAEEMTTPSVPVVHTGTEAAFDVVVWALYENRAQKIERSVVLPGEQIDIDVPSWKPCEPSWLPSHFDHTTVEVDVHWRTKHKALRHERLYTG
ncbi:MAG: hypothetical protein J2P16_00255 [Mycobacterium sp.]|nr:hypothetical protein [Mycobacterium sp.]